jgi:hypothetical protein
MADPIRRLESGNISVAGVSNLPQPNMNFGTQRPEIAFQAAAEASSTIGRVISNLSASMFGQAEKLAEAAGAEFVMENPPSQAQLEAMSKGDPSSFKKNFSLNAYQASIQKFRAIELSAHAEIEITKAAGIIQRRIETGKDEQGNSYDVSTKKVVEDFQSMINGWSSSLASVSPDAAYKYRATAATHANRVLLLASQKESQIALAKNKVKIAAEIDNYSNTVANIIQNALPVPGLSIDQQIEAERARIVTNAITLGGADAGNFALEQLGTIERDIKISVLENAVVSRMEGLGGDLTALNARIKSRSLPPDLQRVWDSMSITDQKKARDKMVGQYQQLIDLKQKDRDVRKVDLTTEANDATLTYLNPEASADQRLIALDTLERISRQDSSVVGAKLVREELPSLLQKMMKEDVDDDFESVARLRDKLSNKDPNLKTTEDILRYAKGNRIKPDTALKLAGEFLPKDAALIDKKTKAQQIEFDLRTKKISTQQQLKVAIEAAGLTMADAPQDWPALLSAKPEDPDDDPRAVTELIYQIDNNLITDARQVYSFATGKRIKGETVSSLAKRVGDRKLQMDGQVKRGADEVAESSGIRNPQNKARIQLDLEKEIAAELEQQKTDYKNGKRTAPPNANEAKRTVEGRFLNEQEQKKLEATKNDLNSAYGKGGTSLPKDAREKNIDLISIQPSFEPGTAVKVTPSYRKRLVDELAKTKASQGEVEAIVQAIINSQESIETIERKRRARGGR